MTTKQVHVCRCDRSGQLLELPDSPGGPPDFAVSVPWLPGLGELATSAPHGAQGEGLDCAAMQDLGDPQRLIVARLLARLLKLPERTLLNLAEARDGRPLRVALGQLGEPDDDGQLGEPEADGLA